MKMKLKYYLKRILNNKLKLSIVILIFLFVIIDAFTYLSDMQLESPVPLPDLTSVLSARSDIRFVFGLLIWYMPLFLLLIVADDCIEDYKLGYKQLLISKWGKRSYLRTNLIKGFVISFGVFFVALMVNLGVVNLMYAGGTSLGCSLDDLSGMELWEYQNPFLNNIIHIVLTSFFAGVVGMGAVAIAISLHNRLLVYPIVFMMWYIPSSLCENTIIYAIQPFTEYSIFYATPPIIQLIVINLIAVIFMYIKELKYAKV
jgi:hypothetical protein